MSIDVSVVVPVYNTEEYLPQCVESLLRQTQRNVEFIFVDDGSTDRSVEILEQFRQRDDRIRIIRQKNLYAGVARNNGMAAATGKYIIFLDSDDFFHPRMLESAFRCAEKNQAEIVVFGFYRYNSVTEKIERVPFDSLPSAVFSFEDIGGRIFSTECAVPWNRLFLRSFVIASGLKFQSSRTCNDEFFGRMIVTTANRIVYLKRRFVFYRINNSQSLQGIVRKEAVEGFSNVLSFLEAMKQELTVRGKYKSEMRSAFLSFANQCIKYRLQLSTDQQTELRKSYDAAIQRLIPGIFDSPEDFEQDKMITNIYKSRDFEEFLFLQYRDTAELLKSDYISKKSYDYRVGHALMRFPRWIKRLLNK